MDLGDWISSIPLPSHSPVCIVLNGGTGCNVRLQLNSLLLVFVVLSLSGGIQVATSKSSCLTCLYALTVGFPRVFSHHNHHKYKTVKNVVTNNVEKTIKATTPSSCLCVWTLSLFNLI